MTRKIVEQISDELLHQDLEKYRLRALELGATDAKIITTDIITIHEKVRIKCIIPACIRYGTNAHCPPNAVDLDLMRKVVSGFKYAIFSKIEVPSEELAGPIAVERKLNLPSARKNNEIVGTIESEAFSDGYYLAVGLSNASCQNTFCQGADCAVMSSGQKCRFPFQARPSMEAVGIDAFMLATKVGWDVYPIGRSTQPADVPCGLTLGLILIY